MKIIFYIFLFFCAFCEAQNVPNQYQGKYFYRCNDTIKNTANFSIKPDIKLTKFLLKQGLLFVDSVSLKTDVQHGYDTIINVSNLLKTNPFFVYKTEVSNAEYKLFATAMKAPAYFPDTSVWNDPVYGNHPYSSYYFQHKAYKDYPVVGVSHWQAAQYCIWKTQKLNEDLIKNGILNYRVEVALPSDAEWLASYQTYIVGWLKSRKNTCGYGVQNSYLDYALGCGYYRCNFLLLTTLRNAEVKQPRVGIEYPKFGTWEASFIAAPCQSYQNTLGMYNLLGNVAEWTSTPALGNLFNNVEYIYTMTNKIIPNNQTKIDSHLLSKYLHEPKVMSQYYCVKGGSWMDEIYYLQPAAEQFVYEHKTSPGIGFRYVVKVYKK